MEKFRIKHGTIAWLVERYIAEMNGLNGQPAVKTLGETHYYKLRQLQRFPIAKVKALEITKRDLIDLCRSRIAEGVSPATVNHDVTAISGVLKYAGSAWEDCEEVSDAAVIAAKPFLVKHNLISKSVPRSRRPSLEETDRLLAYFGREARKPAANEINMVNMTRWQLASGRRVGESCKLLWEDWNRESHTILVRKMKDPKNRNKRKIVALPEAAQAMLVALWEKRNPAEARIFPYRSKSVSAAYTRAKRELGIKDLRLHDSRRDCYTRLVEDQGYSLEEAILVTGHETIAIPQRTYLAMKPENFRLGPKARRHEVTAEVLPTIGNTGYLEAATKVNPGPLPEELRKRHDD